MTTEAKKQRFWNDYQALCKKHGLQIAFGPKFTNTGDPSNPVYGIVIEASITEFTPEAKK